MNKSKSIPATIVRWIWFVFWALFVNAVYVWVLRPLVDDLAMYGVLLVAAIGVVWLSTIDRSLRRSWVSYTLFVLMLAQGFATLSFGGTAKLIAVTVVMIVGLWIIAVWFGKTSPWASLLGGIAVVLSQIVLPLNDWAFLPHFRVLDDSHVNLQAQNSPEAPMAIVPTNGGDAMITIDGYVPSSTELEQMALAATDSPDALFNVLQTADGEYQIIELKDVNGKLQKVNPTPAELAEVNPMDLVRAFFPYEKANWYVSHGRIYEYLTPYLTDSEAVQAALDPAAYPASFQAIANQAAAAETANWNDCLAQLGVTPHRTGVYVQNDQLLGTDAGRPISIPVKASSVVGIGHFTSNHSDQVLLVGNNALHIVDLQTGKVVATYRGTIDSPVPNDIKIGPITSGGRDAIFVNASPAYILTVRANGQWQRVYTATSPTFRFETVLSNGKGAPEIVTNDPSMIRNSPIRYFSAYRFVPDGNGHGQLVRDWRVFRTNVVNVTPLRLSSSAPDVLALDIYGTGDYLVVARTNWPLLPLSCVVLALIFIGGWLYRPSRRKEGERR
ncbi:hypothetical protein SD51_11620 [Alicyclobacillus tengchongensis]|nr:hypothetical protein SD51_11620 [Alicyclobacillus tengchongensis]